MVASVSLNGNRSYQVFDSEPRSIEQKIAAVALVAIGAAAIAAFSLTLPGVEAAFAAFVIGGTVLVIAAAILSSGSAYFSPVSPFPRVHYHTPLLSRSAVFFPTLTTRVPTFVREEPRVRVGGGHFQLMSGPGFSSSDQRVRVGGGHVSGGRPSVPPSRSESARVPVGRR